MWSLPHSGHVSVIVTVTDLWFESLLHRPCNATARKVIPLPDIWPIQLQFRQETAVLPEAINTGGMVEVSDDATKGWEEAQPCNSATYRQARHCAKGAGQMHNVTQDKCCDQASVLLKRRMLTAKGPPMSTHLISKHSPHALAGPATENELLSERAATLQYGYESFEIVP